MRGWGSMGHAGWGHGPRGGYGAPFPVVGLAVGAVILFLAVASVDFFPFFLFWWAIPLFFVLSMRGLFVGGRSRRSVGGDLEEKELLGALSRNGELTAAGAALETSLSVSEADRMLTELAKEGHVQVRAREGRLAYALWEHDRKQLEG